MGRQVFITIQKINQKFLFFHSTLLHIAPIIIGENENEAVCKHQQLLKAKIRLQWWIEESSLGH